jgi:hypothetical protein
MPYLDTCELTNQVPLHQPIDIRMPRLAGGWR